MIRLVTVIGHGVELLPHFIKHYQRNVNEIHIVCYNSDLYPNISSEVSDIIGGYDNVSIVKEVYDRIFDWDRVTKLYNEVKLTHKRDWWIVADIDEFHLYPNDDLQKLIWECEENGWDIVRGGFIDRIDIDGTFASINNIESIWKQFPNMGFFRYQLSKACPNKICVMRGNIELTGGQHYAIIDTHTTWRWQGWNHPLIAPYQEYSVQVHHFKWDKTSIQRLKEVADVSSEYACSHEYLKMYDELRKTNFKINLKNKNFMFLKSDIASFKSYIHWNKLIRKIISI